MRILDVDELAPADAAAITAHLIPGEVVHAAFRSPSAAVLFTERRILHIQREALLSEKVETSSYSYLAIRHFSLVEASDGETRAALRVWLGAEPNPLHLRANPGADFALVQRLLASKLA
jgi:hypothetical protein